MKPNCFGDVFDDQHTMFQLNAFYKGQRVMPKKRIPKIGMVEIVFVNSRHSPTLYECKSLDGKKEYAFYEPELTTVYRHGKEL